ncbi:hypothetical protein OH76DRAFT_394270 [Lentinus brumalis]|uniref:DUF6534 domain-containing protein n=1 Tax=Lentinus brumalis TaxID=2498619 RepID=A0A371DVI3_9APHY|nr:hypothetical protein OH76DRAFT_394270 [Polyporus brumalis]
MPAADVPGNIGLLAGPQLFGHLFNYGLFGILTVQVYHYYLLFPRDPTRLKVLIYSLYSIECLQVAMASHDADKVLGAGWGNTEELYRAHWLWITSPVLTGIVSTTVQCYFSWRIYVLSGSALLSVLICLIALLQGCAALASGITAHLIDTTIDLQFKTMPSHIVWMVGSTTCDIVITVCMVYYVSSVAASAEILPDHVRRYAQLSKGRQGLASDALISRLMRLTVETGALTASIACLDLVFFTTFRHNNLHMTPSVLVLVLIPRITLLTDAYNCRALVLTKVYTNTLLMLVNNRARMRQMMMEQDEGTISIPLQWAADRSDLDTPNLDTHPRPRSASLPAVISWNVHDSGVSVGEDHALDVMDVSKDRARADSDEQSHIIS